VEDATLLPLKTWESFYVIVGSSAAALTGLMFVVITLMAERRRQRSAGALDAFGTPTIVHFCIALLAAAIVSAPWPSLAAAAHAIFAVGIGSAIYVLIVTRRAHRQTEYRPVMEDWIWHVVLPLVAYGMFVGAALSMTSYPITLFGVGAGSLLLVFIGIHNAWDTVTYIALDLGPEPNESAAPSESTPAPSSPTDAKISVGAP
jgi:hypothetical protein